MKCLTKAYCSHSSILLLLAFTSMNLTLAQKQIRVLNFQADSGYQHDSKEVALQLIENLGLKNNWEVVSSSGTSVLNTATLSNIDVVVFNNNCGTDGPIFSEVQQHALQKYIRAGGGFVGIHCAGAIWKEKEEFQLWYEGLIGTRLVAHPHVQEATLTIENQDHNISKHLPKKWNIKDEWHMFSSNPRGNVNVLLSLDEDSYEASEDLKMGGDHPFTWYQYYDGGRSFFTSLGHTKETYENADFQKLIEEGILWANGYGGDKNEMGLILDLDADESVTTNEDNEVLHWKNQVTHSLAKDFYPKDYGIRMAMPGSGRPKLKTKISEIKGHNSVIFNEDELINEQEDVFDYLLTGSGYTWFTVIKPYTTANPEEATEFGLHRLKDVNSFMGNLKNGGNYEGLWGCFDDDLTIWSGSRSGVTFGRFDENNPKVSGIQLKPDQFYIVASRVGSGTDMVDVELFVNGINPVGTKKFPVNINANPSKLAIGTERDATNHPGSESFDGEIARVLIYERPLDYIEMSSVFEELKIKYDIIE